jgi:thioredoxin reductase (NADPH)
VNQQTSARQPWDTGDLSCDVVVVGAGAAGLSAAVALARSLRSVVVIDGGDPRNAVSAHAHNVLGREGIRPLDLLAEGRREAVGYGVRFLDNRAVRARRAGDSLEIEVADGTVVRARRLLLATGLIDELPEVPGLQEFWGSSVLHCPYCHGWEVRGQRIGVLATSAMSLHQALLFRQLSENVTLFVQDLEVPAQTAAQFAALGVETVQGTVRRVSGSDGDLVVHLDDSEVGVRALVVAPRFHARADLFAQLGGELAAHPYGSFVPTDATGATTVAGVWAAGNLADLMAWVAASTASGVLAGAAVNADLAVADANAAVASMGGSATIG